MENEEYAGAEKQILSITSVSTRRRQGPKTRQQYEERVRARRGTVSCGGIWAYACERTEWQTCAM